MFSQSRGKYIIVKFDQPLLNDFTGAVSNALYPLKLSELSTNLNEQNLDRLLDDSNSQGWPYQYRNTNNWVEIEPATPIKVNQISIRSASGGRYNSWAFEGWNGTEWETIVAGSHSAYDQDVTYEFEEVDYEKYRIHTGGSRTGNYPGFYDLRLRGSFQSHLNNSAFTVKGEEYKYVQGPNDNGPIIEKKYQIKSVYGDTEDSTKVIIEMESIEGRFNDVQGDINVSYDSTAGNLFGSGGDVESFSASFTPENLEEEPNPGHTERISVAPSVEAEFVAIDYQEAFNDGEQLSVTAVSVEAELIHIDIINP